MTSRKFTIPGLNGGRSFEVGSHLISPAVVQAATRAKRQAIAHGKAEVIEATEGLPEAMVAEVIKDFKQEVKIAHANALLFEVMCRVDPELRRTSSVPEVLELVCKDGLETYTAIMEALGGDAAAKAAGKAAEAAPEGDEGTTPPLASPA